MTINQKLVETLASQCVKCALCLPHCPTYKLTEDENESPRGRIELFKAIAQEALPLNKKSKGHLDRCLGCLACERVCPAKVEYGALLDQGRHLLNQRDPALKRTNIPLGLNLFIQCLALPSFMRLLHWILWGFDRLGLRAFAKLLPLQRYNQILPKRISKPLSLPQHTAAVGTQRGTVMLFVGCLTPLCDAQTLFSAIEVLRQCGYAVVIPPEQTCCGAVNQHLGDLEKAQQLAEQNQRAFKINESNFDAVISLATGCTVVLDDYQPKTIDVISFLLQQGAIPTERLRPLPLDVWVQTPCTRRNDLRECTDPIKLLQQIPELKLHVINNPDCCGAAGTYMITQPVMADSLADKLINPIENVDVGYLATTNIGCSLHLQQRLNAHQKSIKVIHPIVLLAQSLSPL